MHIEGEPSETPHAGHTHSQKCAYNMLLTGHPLSTLQMPARAASLGQARDSAGRFRASRAPGRRVHPGTPPTHPPMPLRPPGAGAGPLERRRAEREQHLRVDDGVRLQRGLHVGLVPVVLEAVGEVPVHRLPQAALPGRALAPA